MLKIVPLIPAKLRWVALFVGAALQGGAFFLPQYQGYCWLLGAVAWGLAGLGSKMPSWLAGKPLVPVALVPVLLSVLALADKFLPGVMEHLPETVQAIAGLVYLVLSYAAGKVLPEPLTVTDKPKGYSPGDKVPVDVTATIVGECSIADRVRGLC